jgi:septum formation protein
MKNMKHPPIILASNSPRRYQLLTQIGIDFSVIPSDVDEDFSLTLPPEAFTEHWAREKAKNVATKHPDKWIIGADTIVCLDGKIFGKPKSQNDSFNMLSALSGKTHEVITGVSIIGLNSEIDLTFNERTFVSFKTLTDSDIRYYYKNYNPLDKAGSYGIQDWFSVHIHKIDGCYFNVMGFPLSAFHTQFKTLLSLNISS